MKKKHFQFYSQSRFNAPRFAAGLLIMILTLCAAETLHADLGSFKDRSGGTFGFDMRIYPFKPLSLQAKLGAQIFEHVSLGEIEVQAGFMLKNWEIFAGWRWWTVEHDGGRYQGVFAGGRYFF